MLIDRGANSNIKGCEGNTALIWAAYNGHTEIVKALIVAGADINTKNDYGHTVLSVAKNRNNPEIVELLKSRVIEEEKCLIM